ncbi:hypothetical protein [Paenibacillus taihuensis]|nr:hypothetical protein [Paenibacillus taihuensis]
MLKKISKIVLLVMLVTAFSFAGSGSGSLPFLANAANAEAAVLYEEDFSGTTPADWAISSTGSVSGGALHIGDWANYHEQAIYGGETFTGPYSFSADVKASASSGNWNATRMLFNIQDDNNGYELIIGNKNDTAESNVELVKKVNGVDTTIANGVNYPLSKAVTTLQVVVDNGTISVYARQGSTVTTIIDHLSDSTFNAGRIGIGTRSAIVDFDNVRR